MALEHIWGTLLSLGGHLGHLGVTWVALGGHLELTLDALGSLWEHLGSTFGSPGDHFGFQSGSDPTLDGSMYGSMCKSNENRQCFLHVA